MCFIHVFKECPALYIMKQILRFFLCVCTPALFVTKASVCEPVAAISNSVCIATAALFTSVCIAAETLSTSVCVAVVSPSATACTSASLVGFALGGGDSSRLHTEPRRDRRSQSKTASGLCG